LSYDITQADILNWAAAYDGPLFHALITDPPYHLTRPTAGGPSGAGTGHRGHRFAGIDLGFMGRSWDGGDIAFRSETWAALGRLLHPGAFGMAFASTRGFHRMAVAIEDAGFIIHPVIMCWGFFTGFPKATRLDVQIDRAAGATPLAQTWGGHRYGLQALKPALEPLIVFQKPYQGRPIDCITRTGAGAINIDQARIMPSSPLHDDRAYTLRSSRGSDACMLDHSLAQIRNCLLYVSSVLRSGSTGDTYPLHDEDDQDDTRLDPAVCGHLLDRLYPNGAWCGLDLSVVQGYQDGCLPYSHSYDELLHRAQEAALTSAPSLADALSHICMALSEPSHNPPNSDSGPHSSADVLSLSLSLLKLLIGDADAIYDAIIAYSTPPVKNARSEPAELGRWPANLILSHHPECNDSCVELCPVRRLGEQSGESEAKRAPRGAVNVGTFGGTAGSVDGTRNWKDDHQERGHDDSGTAARYFFNSDYMAERLEDSDPLIYQAKASTAEREAGLEDFPTITVDDGRQKSIDNPYQRGETTRRNIHPTVKPISLARHLATLLLPPGLYAPRRLLVPFAGVASEMIGAMLAGWEVVQGIELESDHIEIARARLAFWQQMRYKLMNPDVPVKVSVSRAPAGQTDMFESEAA